MFNQIRKHFVVWRVDVVFERPAQQVVQDAVAGNRWRWGVIELERIPDLRGGASPDDALLPHRDLEDFE